MNFQDVVEALRQIQFIWIVRLKAERLCFRFSTIVNRAKHERYFQAKNKIWKKARPKFLPVEPSWLGLIRNSELFDAQLAD